VKVLGVDLDWTGLVTLRPFTSSEGHILLLNEA